MPRNVTTQLALFRHLIEGLKKHMASVTQVTFQGASYTPSALIQLLQDLVDAGSVVAAAKTSFHDAVTALREKIQAASSVVRGLKSYLLVLYKDASTLADFGLAPRKPRKTPPLPAAMEVSQKRQATRAARHTMGKRQKRKVKVTASQPPNNGAANGNGGPAMPAK